MNIAKIKGTYSFVNKVSIKDVKVGKVYYIDKHHHGIYNYEITIEDQRVKCLHNDIKGDKQDIWLQLEKPHKDLDNEDWKNSLIFIFPDDEHYDDLMLYKGEKVK
jgi:hypothetical protein